MLLGKNRVLKGLNNPRKAIKYLWNNYHPRYPFEDTYLAYNSKHPIGTHIFDRNWDVLVILDTCRVDVLRSIASEYPYLNTVNRIWSLGGTSPEWIGNTFDARYRNQLQNTAYLCANPHGGTVLDDRKYVPKKHGRALKRFYRYGTWDTVQPETIGLFDRIWLYEYETVGDYQVREQEVAPKRYVTDRAIRVSRESNYDRMILHYMQPHFPYVANAIAEDRQIRTYEERPKRVRDEGRAPVWNAYVDNLRYILDELELLFSNIDADTVVISSDHGEAFGEQGVYGHDPGVFHPSVRYVPWVETSAKDTGETYKPSLEPLREVPDHTAEHLEALGYK